MAAPKLNAPLPMVPLTTKELGLGGISKLLSNYTKFTPLLFFLFLRLLNLPELSLASPKPSFYPLGPA